jgi:hypothetical protein
MDKKSALLQALYVRLQEKLGLPVIRTLTTRGFKTYEFSYHEAITKLERAKEPFGYQAIVNDLLAKALKL